MIASAAGIAAAPASDVSIAQRRQVSLGWLPRAGLAGGSGLVLVAIAGTRSLQGDTNALGIWWLGVLIIVVPVLWRLWGTEASAAQRVGLVALLGLTLFAVHVLSSPTSFKEPDEFSHLRTWSDLAATARAFSPNPLLLISPAYPGLEAGTIGVQAASGLSVFAAGTLLLAFARLVLVVSIFLLSWSISGSARIAGLAAAVYMSNPSFVFFDAEWSYESLALPLAFAALLVTWRWANADRPTRLYRLATIVLIAATALTHHLTSLVLLAVLLGWTGVAAVRFDERWRRIGAATLVALVANGLWLFVAAGGALGYLGDLVQHAAQSLADVVAGGSSARPLFHAPPGFGVPPLETLLAYGGTLLLLGLLALAWIHVLREHRDQPIVIVFLLAALVFPVTLALRFTGAGAETSQRASEFLYLALGYLVADATVHLIRIGRRWVSALAVAALAIVMASGIVVGTVWYVRMPGPYHVAAEQLSIEPQGEAAASWALSNLGPGNRIIADRTNQKLFASIGRQDPITAYNSHLGTAYVMWDVGLTDEDLQVLRDGRIEYVLADLRTSRNPPVYLYYYEQAEPDAGAHLTPWPAGGLVKWDTLPGVRRVFDSGDIILYDVRGLVGGDH